MTDHVRYMTDTQNAIASTLWGLFCFPCQMTDDFLFFLYINYKNKLILKTFFICHVYSNIVYYIDI